MAKTKKTPEKDTFLRAWRAKAFLRINGFLADSELKKINARLIKYQEKHKIEVTDAELF